jgi:phage host-nuclease inhibitor protein Gam
LSVRAAGLEAAGKAGDTAFIQENLPVFAECLAGLTGGIRAWEKAMKEHDSEKQAAAGSPSPSSVIPLLHELAAALKSQKADNIDRVLEHLLRQPLDAVIKTAAEQISDEVLMAEYDKAAGILEGLLKQGAVDEIKAK